MRKLTAIALILVPALSFAQLESRYLSSDKELYKKNHICEYCELSNAYLDSFAGADLKGSNLTHSNFYGNLEKANFSLAKLTSTSLEYCNLTFANFSGALLDGTNFFRADLSSVNFSNATVDNINLKSANLCHSNITEEQLANSKKDEHTILPNCQHYIEKDKN